MIVLGHNTGDLSTELSERPGRSLVFLRQEGVSVLQGRQGSLYTGMHSESDLGEAPETKKVGAGVTLPPKRRVWDNKWEESRKEASLRVSQELGHLDIFALNF